MHVVVGLGNPGDEYRATRHNVGFEVIERLAARHYGSLGRDRTLNAVAGRVRITGTADGEDVLLVEPQTYMNLSGAVVRRALERAAERLGRDAGRSLPVKRLMVVSDDYHLSLGVLRCRAGGSAGGHNGLADVQRHLGTQQYPRLRLGIGEPTTRDSRDFVLGRFRASEREAAEEMLDRAADAVECWLREGIEPTMSRYNGGPERESGDRRGGRTDEG